VLQGFAAPSNTCIKFYFFALEWQQIVFKRIQDGVPLKSRRNAQHHNSKPTYII
jgi:hypothetical protein